MLKNTSEKTRQQLAEALVLKAAETPNYQAVVVSSKIADGHNLIRNTISTLVNLKEIAPKDFRSFPLTRADAFLHYNGSRICFGTGTMRDECLRGQRFDTVWVLDGVSVGDMIDCKAALDEGGEIRIDYDYRQDEGGATNGDENKQDRPLRVNTSAAYLIALQRGCAHSCFTSLNSTEGNPSSTAFSVTIRIFSTVEAGTVGSDGGSGGSTSLVMVAAIAPMSVPPRAMSTSLAPTSDLSPNAKAKPQSTNAPIRARASTLKRISFMGETSSGYAVAASRARSACRITGTATRGTGVRSRLISHAPTGPYPRLAGRLDAT